MKIKAINNFNLPTKKVGIWKYAGFLSRKSHVFVKYEDNNEKLLTYDEANNEFMSTILNILTEKEYQILNQFRSKIEKPNERSITLAKKVICDYNFEYNNKSWYSSSSQVNLIKLEQLFIQNNLESNCIEKYSKPCAPKISGHNVVDILFRITDNKLDRILYLREYIDEYFQYLFDIPKNIWKINNLHLPILESERTNIKINQYASYISRNSLVKVVTINYTTKVNYVDANESFVTWFRSITSNDEDLLQLKNYRHKIENLSDNVKKLGKELISDYDHETDNNSKKQQSLIYLEQFLIRYNIPTSYVLDCIRNKKMEYYKRDAIEWVSKLTNKEKSKIKKLKNYLDEYLSHTVNRSKNEKISQNIQEVDNERNILEDKKILN